MTQITPQQIDSWIERTTPSPRENYPVYFIFGLFIASILAPIVLPLFTNAKWQWEQLEVIPWVLLTIILLISRWRASKRRRSNERVEQIWENAKLERWDAVDTALPTTFNHPIYDPTLRGRAFMIVAGLLESRKQHDVAGHIYESLLRRRMGDPLTLHQAQLSLASAKLRNEELTDAVQLIGRLQKIEMPPPLRAIFEAVRLHQQVFMGQNEDAVDKISERRDLFRRHLSTRAGYTYGLLAAALHRLGRKDEAQQYWHDATLLVPPAKLTDRFELLGDVAPHYQSSHSPL